MHQELMAFEDTPIEEVKFASIPIVSSYKISTLLSEFQKVNKNRRQVVNYNILEEEQKDVLMLLKTIRWILLLCATVLTSCPNMSIGCL